MVHPSSVDVRLDRYFRTFENHRYPHIDPSEAQSELTRMVEPSGEDPFILHPGEFVLGSTQETVSLPPDVAARLAGKSSLGRLGLLTHSTAGSTIYGSRYQGQRGPTPSRSFLNFHRTQVESARDE